MINEYELRKGNYILENAVVKKVVHLEEDVIEIAAMHNTDESVYKTTDDAKVVEVKLGFYVSYEDAEPIPLTPEVLEKCGLCIADGTSDEIRVGRLVIQFSLYEQGYKANLFIGGEYLGHKEHLHQFQNLYFALTGTELTYTP